MTSEFGKNRYNRYGQPSLDLVFTGSKKSLKSRIGNQQVEFTRDSVGTYIDENGIIQTSNVNEPRFDHDPVTGESLGLLIEEERTNLSLNSNSYTSWGTANQTSPLPTNNTQISPDGTQTAWQFPIGSTGVLQRNYNITAGQSYTFSFFAKQGSVTAMGTGYIGVLTDDVFTGTIYNWSTNTLGSGWSKVDYSNGWSRFYRTFTSLTNTLFIQRMDSSYGTGQYIWGAQLEPNASFPTSYIPTDGTPGGITRAADVASIEGTNFSSWFNQSEGTWFTEAKSDDGVNGVFGVGGLTNPVGGLSYDFNGFNVLWQGSVMNGGFNPVDGQFHKFAFTATRTSNTLTADGVQNDTDTATTSVDGIELGIGVRDSFGPGFSSTYLNGHIARLTYWPTRLPDSDLQELTQ